MKFNLLSFVAFLFLFNSVSLAQEIPEPLIPTERVTYGNHQHTSRDAVFFSKKDSRGNLIVVGYTERDFSFSDVQIMSLDKNLNLLWSDRLSWGGISYDYPMDLLIDENDHIWVISKNALNTSQANFVVARYTPGGKKLWEYKSPETIETSTLNMNQYHYFFDENGYLNFNYLKGMEYNGTPTFFRLSPSGTAVDEYQVNANMSHLSHTTTRYQGLSYRYSSPDELYYLSFNEDMYEEKLLALNELQVDRVQNSIYENSTSSFTDLADNYILVAQGNFHDNTGFLHKGSIILSVKPSGELNYFLDDNGSIDKYLLGAKITAENNLLVISNTQPITEENKEPLLTLELFSEEGELIYSRRSESAVGNTVKILDGQILVRTLDDNISIFDFNLNKLSETQIPPTEEIFYPQDVHLLEDDPVLVGTTSADRYEGSNFHSEENYLIRKFNDGKVSAQFSFDGEGTSKFYNYHMIKDEAGNISISADEFLGPNNLNLGGSRAPREKKIISYNKDLEYLGEEIVDRDYQLWEEPSFSFKAENGDIYKYEVQEDRKTVDFFLNDKLKWSRQINYDNNSYIDIEYTNTVDRNGNFIVNSSLYGTGRGRIHKFTPDNEYSFTDTGSNAESIVVLSNNWIFAYYRDYSIKVFSPSLELINSRQYDENFFFSEYYPYLVEKNNKVLLNIRHRNLVMVFDQFGDYKDRFTLEGLLHPSVSFFDKNDALNVYHLVGQGIRLEHGHNWSRLAISRYSNIVEDYIGELPAGDLDEDGVSDFIDECPDTPKGVPVGENGCALLQLPFNNFSITTKDESCAGQNNGRLLIEAMEEHDYIVEIDGTEHHFTTAISFESLAPGNYVACIKIEGEETPRQCIEFNISSGQTFRAKTLKQGNLISVEVEEGTAPYFVKLNGESAGSFNTTNFSIDVNPGDRLELSSDINCEGALQVDLSGNSLQLLSNPVKDVAEIILPNTGVEKVKVSVYNNSGHLIISGTYNTANSLQLDIDTSTFAPGVYYAIITLDKPYSLKLIKR